MAAPDRNAGGFGAGIAIGAFIVLPVVVLLIKLITLIIHHI